MSYTTSGSHFSKVIIISRRIFHLSVIRIVSKVTFILTYILFLISERIFKLQMFRHDQGSWLVMAATTAFVLFIFSWIYNLFLLAGGKDMEPYKYGLNLGFLGDQFISPLNVCLDCEAFTSKVKIKVKICGLQYFGSV